MKERPILFSAPMVRAILEDRKTQTRRVVKPAPTMVDERAKKIVPFAGPAELIVAQRRCPYGVPGDRLWVRERHAFNDVSREAKNGEGWPRQWWVNVEYADGFERVMLVDKKPKQTRERGELGWRPSIHMPRWASRINLEVTGVRVERLQDIQFNEADAIAEGAQRARISERAEFSATEDFKNIWHNINGAESWAANPWVWVVEFKRVTP